MITRGIQGWVTASREILQTVRGFSSFDADNDPWQEHEFGSFKFDGETILWKIDYYNADMTGGSEDPADPQQTERVLTVLFASEY